jgi:hypothetical protein
MKGYDRALPSFSQYINKAFALRRHLATLQDGRRDSMFPPGTAFSAVF